MGHVYRSLPAREGLFYRGRPAPPTLVVVHSTEGATAEGAARWFQNPNARGSAHVVVDDDFVFRCVDDMDVAYHAKGSNTIGLGLEIAGFAGWTRGQWLDHEPRLKESARIAAGWFLKYRIPFTWSSTVGYHSHAGLPGNDHWDPGTGFPWDVWRGFVEGFLDPSTARPDGRTLRVTFPDGRTYGGWTKEEAAYLGPALGALQWIGRQDPARIRAGTVIRWRGSTFDQTERLPIIARTILNRTGGR